MLSLTININGKKYERNVPTWFGELTFRQFNALRSETNISFADTIAILTSIDRKLLGQNKDIDFDYKVYPVFEWYFTEDFNEAIQGLLVPDVVNVGGKEVAKPKGIGFGTYGQKLDLDYITNKANKEGKDDVDIFADILSIYLYPGYSGQEYETEKAESFKEKVLDMQIKEGWPLASFFLQNLERYAKRRAGNFHTILHRKKYQQELKRFKSTEAFQQFSLLRRGLINLMIWLSRFNTLKFSLSWLTKAKHQGTKGSYTIS